MPARLEGMVDEMEFEPRMSDADALMWRIEKDPLLRSTIVSISLLDTTPDRARLVRRIERASRVVPRLRQRVLGHTYSIAPPRWEIDPNFDLHYHLRWVRASGAGTRRELLDLAEPVAMQGFDRARPLWEFVVVEGLEDGRAALIQKVHHAITDGVGGVKLQLELVDLERDPAFDPDAEMPDAPPARDPDELTRLVDAFFYEGRRQATNARHTAGGLAGTFREGLTDPVGVIHRGLALAGSTINLIRPTTEPLSPLMTQRSLSQHFDTITLDLGQLKAASKVVAGRLNDAFVTGVAGGLARYHQANGTPVEHLRMTMPINVRRDDTERQAGNYFVPARFEVPVGLDDPIVRLASIRELCERQRHEPALALTEPLAGLLNRLPTTATTAVFGSMLRGVDFVTSNVPGAPFPVFLAGAKVESQFAFGPMTGAACNLVLLSYVDDVHIGVNMDPAAIVAPDLFMSCLRDSFDEVTKLAS